MSVTVEQALVRLAEYAALIASKDARIAVLEGAWAGVEDRLFAEIAHGDEAHRAWLLSALRGFFERARTTLGETSCG